MCFQGEYLRILLLIRSGDIETNPGPKKTVLLKDFSLEFLLEFIKLSLIESYIAINNFHLVRLSETFQDSSTSNDDSRINMNVLVFITKISYL